MKNKWGLKVTTYITVYLYYINEFSYFSSNITYICQAIIVVSSLLTLTLFLINKQDVNKGGFFYAVFSMSKRCMAILCLSIVIIRELRPFVFDLANLSALNIPGYIFVLFSLTVPTTVLLRILTRTGHDIPALSNNYPYNSNITIIIFAFIKQLLSINNYTLSNIYANNIQLFLYAVVPLFMICPGILDVFLGYTFVFNLAQTECLATNINSSVNYNIFSYDDISFPPGSFANTINLNPEQGITLNQMANWTSAPKPSGSGSLRDFRIRYNGQYWIRTNRGLFFPERNIKSAFTSNLTYTSPPLNLGFTFIMNNRDYYTNPGVVTKIINVENNIGGEYRVDAVAATMIPHFFGVDRGYGFNPQSVLYDEFGDRKKVDFLVDYNNMPVLMVENKGDGPGTDSWLELINQARDYAKCSPSHESCFVQITKGTRTSFFLYEKDWHSDKGLDLKWEGCEDMLGLEFHRNGISIITQMNTYQPQLKIYEMGTSGDITHRLAITSILSYISGFQQITGTTGNLDWNLPLHRGNSTIVVTVSSNPGLNLRLVMDRGGHLLRQ